MQKSALKLASFLLAILTLILSLSACGSGGEGEQSVTEELPVSEEESSTEDTSAPETVPETDEPRETGCQHELMFGVCLLCKKDFSGSEGLFFISNGDGTCRLAGIGSCSDRDIVIPQNSPEGDAVIEIGYRAFAWNEAIKSVTIPESVRLIQKSAFHDCLSLTGVTFEKTKGWTCNGEAIDVSNPARNVGRLLDGDKWEKS